MDLSTPLVTSDGLFEKLMSCPLKRKLVINLIASEKDNIEEYKKNLADQKCTENTSDQSPLRKIQKKYVCESPTALLRRRALEQKNSAEIQWSPAKKTSISSLPVVSNKILAGVVAFIDVKSKDYDRSGGVRALLHSMGATIEQQFNKEVTHVIFKDGSFSTYQRANLMNVHLVSVLWIEACRTSGVKVAEKKFPALGTDAYDHNISALCSQLQKDYEEIIREEYCRSMITGTPLPSTKALIDKRRTIMTPNASSSSLIEKNWSQEYIASEDREVAKINQEGRKNYSYPDQSHTTSSPEITEDDSDLEPFIAGEMIKKRVIGLRDRVTDNQSTEVSDSFTDPFIPTKELNDTNNSQLARKVDISSKENSSPKTPHEFYSKNTPIMNRSRTCNKMYIDKSFLNCSDSDGSAYERQTRSQSSFSSFTNTVNDDALNKKKSLFQVPTSTRIERTETSTKINISSERECDIVNKSSSTSMSTLHLSNNQVENSVNTNMSLLQISSDTNKDMASFNSNNNSFSPIQSNVMKNLLHLLDTSLQSSDNITRRHKKTLPEKNVSGELPKDDSYSKVDENDLVGSCESDNKGDFINIKLNNSSRKPLNRKLKTRKINSPCTGTSKSETTIHENALSGISDKKKYKQTDSTGKSICDVTRNSETHDQSIKIHNNKSRNCLELPEVVKIQKSSNPLPIKSSSIPDSSDREKSVNRNGRKLYDPTDSSQGYLLRNDREWEHVRRNSKNSGEFLKPEVTLSLRAKQFVDKHNINIEKILGDHSEQIHERNQKLIKKERNTNKSVEKHITGDDDEKHKLNRQILTQKCAEECNDTNMQIVEDDSVKQIIDEKNNVVYADEVGKNKENMSKTLISLPKPMKSDEKSARRRCSLRLTQRTRKISTDTISRTEEVLNRTEGSEQCHDTDKKQLRKMEGKNESDGKNITENDDEQFELARRLLGQRCADKCDDLNLYNEIKTKKVDLSSTTSPKTVKTKKLLPDEKSVKRRCSLRLTQHSKKVSTDTLSRTKKKVQDITSKNRRSTREFQTKLNSERKTKIDKLKQPSIVCTKMHKDEIEVFSQIVKKLGSFFIEDEVTRKTTHLVACEPRRTINMLRAIVTGCWIVNRDWLFQSLEAGKWLPEEDFELTEFSPAVQQCRLQRQAFGASYSMDIFHDCGPIFIAKGSTPRCSDLRELVTLCKGKCTSNASNSKIVVGELLKNDGVICVKENWILDSIKLNRRMPFKSYIIPSSTPS